MRGMTDIAWNADAHPRESAGRFAVKEQSAPEATLAEATPWHLRALDDLAPRSEQDNPLMAAFRQNEAEWGDTAAAWADAIERVSDDPESAINDPEVYKQVIDIIGTPHGHGDVVHWGERTRAWSEHAIETLREQARIDHQVAGVESDMCGTCGDFGCDCDVQLTLGRA